VLDQLDHRRRADDEPDPDDHAIGGQPPAPAPPVVTREKLADGSKPRLLLDELRPLDFGLGRNLQPGRHRFSGPHLTAINAAVTGTCITDSIEIMGVSDKLTPKLIASKPFVVAAVA
jgi:hypothetical protein